MYLVSLVSKAIGLSGTSSRNIIIAPLYIAAPNTDSLFQPEQRARTIEILSNNDQKFNMEIISGVSHGFAVSYITYNVRQYTHVLISTTDAQSSR